MSELKYYKNLIAENDFPSYGELLATVEWRKFREKIITRDNHTCTICNQLATQKLEPEDKKYLRKPTKEEIEENEKPIFIDWGNGVSSQMKRATIIGIPIENPIILHVHHLYYIWNNLPWDYNWDALITVCHACHMNIHKNQIIPVYKDGTLTEKMDLITCSRCFGTGFLQEYNYYHEGICFACMGNKYII